METATIITIILGIYGALLTTYTIYRNIREKKRRLSLTIWNGYLTSQHRLSPMMLISTVANPGNREVMISTPYIQLPKGKKLVFPWAFSRVKFPYELEEGKDCSIWIEMEKIKQEFIKLGYSGTTIFGAKVDDRVGNTYKSKKPWKINLEEEYK